ncbi:hypothetical protein ACFY93_08460 [Streptomyces sp. NPDC008313]|uniref:hypothetical protein n=1 Tax=Streptomyces sp. NPDC008313 TaxID=3364826 RepID=UPI0036E40033
MLAAVSVVTACEPTDGLSSAAVAYTTDQTGTRALEKQGIDVRWLSCTATYGGGNKAYTPGKATASSGTRDVAGVDCQGETGDGTDITLKGKVTRAVDGKCVRGDLTARVGGKQRFHVDVLGDCEASDGTSAPGGGSHDPGRPAPTVTVTRTVWCEGDPGCGPVEGK